MTESPASTARDRCSSTSPAQNPCPAPIRWRARCSLDRYGPSTSPFSGCHGSRRSSLMRPAIQQIEGVDFPRSGSGEFPWTLPR
jgi:hypothetical protein